MKEGKLIDYLACSALQLNIHSEDFFDKISDLDSAPNTTKEEYSIYFDDFDEANLFKKLGSLPYFDGGGMNVFKCGRKQEFWKYLGQSFPKRLNDFWLFSIKNSQGPLAKYFNSIIRISHKVSEEVRFSMFHINHYQLKRLITSFKHVKVFTLSECKLSISMIPDFSDALRHTNIQTFEMLYYWKTDDDWEPDPEAFMKLLQGLATSQDFKNSLKTLTIQNSEIIREQVDHFIEQNKLDKVKLLYYE